MAAQIDIRHSTHVSLVATNPDEICETCHKDIYERYERTPMARGSGLAINGFIEGGFLHAPSGIRYKVFLRGGQVWMSYDRDDETAARTGQSPLHGERQLSYFIGSGHRGRTYLYEDNNQWFEAPINYYSKKQLWDMAPNYGSTRTMPNALPVDSNCLHCHATDVQTAFPEARNKYDGVPFKQAGIGCSACHGDPSLHLAKRGRGAIINPKDLTPVRRDSTCLQCHLEGNVAIYRSQKALAQFRPGENLADYVVYFVKASVASGGGRASSQYEALLRSACKVASGDKLTCTTCHDPHSSPNAEERVQYYRNKCLMCHIGPAMATKHHPEQKDCAVCHMPTQETTDISHEQTTDHNIQRYPSTEKSRLSNAFDFDELIPVGNVIPSDREFGLAYAQLAEKGDQKAGERARYFLQRAEKEGSSDAQLHTQLGFIEQMSGNSSSARTEYAYALKQNQYQTTALGNLAILDAISGQSVDAIRLLQRVVDADANQMAAGLDLAFIECRTDRKKEASDVLKTLSQLNPDDPDLRLFINSGVYRGQHCEVP